MPSQWPHDPAPGCPQHGQGVEVVVKVEEAANPVDDVRRKTGAAPGLLSLSRGPVYPAPLRAVNRSTMSDLYKALDFYNVDELYTDEERMIRDTVPGLMCRLSSMYGHEGVSFVTISYDGK